MEFTPRAEELLGGTAVAAFLRANGRADVVLTPYDLDYDLAHQDNPNTALKDTFRRAGIIVPPRGQLFDTIRRMVNRDGTGNNTLVLPIKTPEDTEKPTKWIATTGGRDPLEIILGNINPSLNFSNTRFPGTAQEHRLLAQGHEEGHLLPSQANKTAIAIEPDCDRNGYELYAAALEKQLVHNADVPHAVRALNAMDMMVSGDTDDKHALVFLAPLRGEHPVIEMDAPSDTFVAANLSMEAARRDIMISIAKTTSQSHPQTMLAGALANTPQEILDSMGVSKELKTNLSDAYFQFNASPDQRESNCAKLLQNISIPEGMETFLQLQQDTVLAQEGNRIARENPGLLYEHARLMLKRGIFDDNPVQKAFVGRFVEGAEQYLPDHFQVPDERRPIVFDPANAEPTPATRALAPVAAPGMDLSRR